MQNLLSEKPYAPFVQENQQFLHEKNNEAILTSHALFQRVKDVTNPFNIQSVTLKIIENPYGPSGSSGPSSLIQTTPILQNRKTDQTDQTDQTTSKIPSFHNLNGFFGND